RAARAHGRNVSHHADRELGVRPLHDESRPRPAEMDAPATGSSSGSRAPAGRVRSTPPTSGTRASVPTDAEHVDLGGAANGGFRRRAGARAIESATNAMACAVPRASTPH